MPSKNSKLDYALVQEYEAKSQNKTKEERDALIAEFVKKAIQE